METNDSRPQQRVPTGYPGLNLPATGPTTAYMFLRHIADILDALSTQGLRVWTDEHGSWRWHWEDTSLISQRGFWALGEALLDAVTSCYPAVFVSPVEVLAGPPDE